ncbi:putative peroxisomal biogenesis factor [Clavispora lusitaniae]|uniref:Peroxin-3 n=2 Tax=Clavispora lusitaniae TaxID=36911 RepID=C4YC47_CLAL4|nr:uncharacterized protein CLUG_05864 [Clavispora lusitaniae ATCC 42720]KAF5208697.1 peroxin [Clavispora lusitaniae]EEQ41736.1 hypothetical protein CLUG_05864 [Clavispora lusitaniae ATCC 42720]KAF7580484.1 Peroxin-3 family protein [Clavispora lusitaniae]QFZ30357.1 putative peroxisomal biogenesis factor [Clavispora lusitaniae]QFZ36019.1 putative peroxisomal biogenesis factor [Clavispora lusitaniae]
MAVFSSLATFFRRHKKKLLITSTVSVSLYFLVHHFVISRIRNFQNALKQELFVKEQIKRRFVQTQADCYLTLLALLPVLTSPIVAYLPTEAITSALKRKKNSKKELGDSLTTENLMAYSEERNASSIDLSVLLSKSKLELWQDLKVKSITRMLTLIYASSGLLLLTRLQLNILARKSYLESAIAIAGGSVPPASKDSFNYFIEQSYLSLSWWLLNNGWVDMADHIERLVETKFKDINPKTELSVDTFTIMLSEINSEMFSDGGALVARSIFPIDYGKLVDTLMNTNPELVNELENKDSNLVKLVNETNFIFANNFTLNVFFTLVRNGVETLASNLSLTLDPDQVPGRVHKLATFLASLSVQSSVISDPRNFGEDSEVAGNIYINNLNDVEALDEFSASIYSNFE